MHHKISTDRARVLLQCDLCDSLRAHMPRRISPSERAELVSALETGQVQNMAAFARTYAAEHELSPNTVRAALGRLRRELGLTAVERDVRNPDTVRGISRVCFARVLAGDAAEVAEIGAAALIRYEHDEEFKRLVDSARPDVGTTYESFDHLRNRTTNLVLSELVRAASERGPADKG